MTTPPEAATAPVRPRHSVKLRWFDKRFRWAVFSLLVFVFSTVYFHTLSPYPDPYSRPTWGGWTWWFTPIESNPVARLTYVNQHLSCVTGVPGSKRIWVVGDRGTALRSDDAGETWVSANLPSVPDESRQRAALLSQRNSAGRIPKRARFDAGTTVPAAWQRAPAREVQSNEPAAPSNAGPPEPLRGPDVDVNLTAICFADAKNGWAVGKLGPVEAMYRTTDAGGNWAILPNRNMQGFRDVFFIDEQRGWTNWEFTTDGESWNSGGFEKRLNVTDPFESQAVFFTDASRGWLVGSGATVYRSTDGGQAWELAYPAYAANEPMPSPKTGAQRDPLGRGLQFVTIPARSLDSITFHDVFAIGMKAWIVGDEGTLLVDEEADIREYHLTRRDLFGVHFVDSRRGWVVGDSGTILTTADGGKAWMDQASGVSVALRGVYFGDASTGWAVGDQGTILQTSDGGQTWRRQTRDLDRKEGLPDVSYFGFQPGNAGGASTATEAAIGPRPAEDYRRWPAPGFYVAVLFSVVLLVPLLRPPAHVEQEVADEDVSIGDVFVSDRPLEEGDPDPLDFGPLALAVSKFLRNENTVPPVTIAVTGEWGTGKSSLMNLVHSDLRQRGFRPVWFNAWHHQKEEHLLASLLENIKSQAVPTWADPFTRLRFRLRLLSQRGWRYVWMIPALLVLGAAVGWMAETPIGDHTLLESVRQFVSGSPEASSPAERAADGGRAPAGSDTENQADENKPTAAFHLALLTGFIGLAATIWRGTTAFGLNPAALLVQVSGAAKIGSLGAQVSFRHEFAREFRDVTWALKPRSLVILIDDLDRCRPNNVLEVLESINFLVSSGDCFIICGMAMERVEGCVGLGFHDVAAELVEEEDAREKDGETPEQRARRLRASFAHQYLEKLINIEVPIPAMSPRQSQELLAGAPEELMEEQPSPEPPWLQAFQQVVETAARFGPWSLLVPIAVILVAGALLLGGKGEPEPELLQERETPLQVRDDTTAVPVP